MWAIFPGEEHLQAVKELVLTKSGRVGAVVGGALLDQAVNRTLRARFRDDDGIASSILSVDRPLGNLGPKIDVLCLLGAFDKKTHSTLKGLSGFKPSRGIVAFGCWGVFAMLQPGSVYLKL